MMTSVLKRIRGGDKKGSIALDKTAEYKVQYLGNVFTNTMKGDGCTDKAMVQLWNHYQRSTIEKRPAIQMQLLLTAAGLKAITVEQGETHYHANKITYATAHPDYPRVFCWIYKHQRKMKVEFRCHAVLCKKEEIAKAIAVLLHENMKTAFRDFLRHKRRQHDYRIRQEKLATIASDLHKHCRKSSSLPTMSTVENKTSIKTQHSINNINNNKQINGNLYGTMNNGQSNKKSITLSSNSGAGVIFQSTMSSHQQEKLKSMANNFRPPPVSNSSLKPIDESMEEEEEESTLPYCDNHVKSDNETTSTAFMNNTHNIDSSHHLQLEKLLQNNNGNPNSNQETSNTKTSNTFTNSGETSTQSAANFNPVDSESPTSAAHSATHDEIVKSSSSDSLLRVCDEQLSGDTDSIDTDASSFDSSDIDIEIGNDIEALKQDSNVVDAVQEGVVVRL